MDAEFSVELGPDDPTLAVPWQCPDGTIAYVDLRLAPEAIDGLAEVRAFPELADFLRALNAPHSPYQTAKCDAWFDSLMDVEDEPYDSVMKCASYVDVFLANDVLAPFLEQEKRGREIVKQVHAAEDLPARMELVVRRAYFGEVQGFYWTIYLFGYGEDLPAARTAWTSALQVLQSVMRAC